MAMLPDQPPLSRQNRILQLENAFEDNRIMARRIVIIQGHPDPAGHHLLHAMADAYAEGATTAGLEVRRIEVAHLEFPLLRTQADFETGALPLSLVQPREDMHWAEHWLFLFPLSHGTMPALFKGFLEQILRPGFAMEYKKQGFPKRLLAGRSARIVVTMGMPALLYRWYFGAYGVRGFERSMLSFAGIKPIRESLYGLTFADEKKRARWIEDLRRRGGRGE
jgi:putative NADPH-quinone reductase